MKPSVLIVGLGDLGSVVLELLAREEGIGRIVAAGRNYERGAARCNLARIAAIAQGYNPDITFLTLDLNDKDSAANVISEVSPDILLYTATMQTWWLPNLLPADNADLLKQAGFGMWLPVHLALTIKMMQAVKDADYQGITLIAPFPDVVNCVLGKIGLAPTCGVGNVDELVSKTRYLVSKKLKSSLDSVTVFLVAHHALQAYSFGRKNGKAPPFFLKVEHNGENITESINASDLLLTPYQLSPGRPIHFLTGGCTIRLIKSLFSSQKSLLHVPGPHGLPGGYPVIVGKKSVETADLDEISLKEAVAINEQSHRFDGIESIEEDGTVIFLEESTEIFRNELGYDCESLKPDEAEENANELIGKFHEYAKNLGVSFQNQ